MCQVKPSVKFITCDSGEWCVLKVTTEEGTSVFEGHSISDDVWLTSLAMSGCHVTRALISEEDMEYGNY